MATSHNREETSDDRDSSQAGECKDAVLKYAEEGWMEKDFWSQFEASRKTSIDDAAFNKRTSLAYVCLKHYLMAELRFSPREGCGNAVKISTLRSALQDCCLLIIQALVKRNDYADTAFIVNANGLIIRGSDQLALIMQHSYCVSVVKERLPSFYFKKKFTSLHLASSFGHLSVVQLLIENGADVNNVNTYGRSPLYWACENGHLSVAQLLIERGAGVDQAEWFGQTSLSTSCSRGDILIAQHLIKSGADVNIGNNNGYTPLQGAVVRSGHDHFAQLLLTAGADVDQCDSKGRTPLHFALSYGRTSALNLLFNYHLSHEDAWKYSA